MCGRYTHLYTWKQLHRLLRLASWPQEELPLRYNVAPTQRAPVVRVGEAGEREGAMLRWGLVPHWVKSPSELRSNLINARAETAHEKPAFRQAWKRRRCVVPANGFYEWQAQGKGQRKQPYYIHPPEEDSVLCLAGLWERWSGGKGAAGNSGDGAGVSDGGGEPPVESFTILTTEPNDLLKPIHNRMPAILSAGAVDAWLAPDADADALAALLGPCDPALLTTQPVSTRVNSPASDDPACVAPLSTDAASSNDLT